MTLSTPVICQRFPTGTSPIGAMPMQYNSSFAGSTGKSRLASNASFERLDDGTSQSYHFHAFASYDTFLPKLRSGIGIKMSGYGFSNDYDSESNGSHHFSGKGTGISFVAAPKISIKGKYTISPSLDFGFSSSHFDYYGNGQNWTPNPELDTGIKYRLNSSIGLLFNTDRYYFGYSISLFAGEFGDIKLNSFYSNLQVGYTFQRNDQSKFSFTPQFRVVIKDKDEYYTYNVSKPFYNLGIRYGQILTSIISSNDFKPNGFQIGWQKNGWRIISSNEFNKHYHYTIYIPSLSVRYIFNRQEKSIHVYDQSF